MKQKNVSGATSGPLVYITPF